MLSSIHVALCRDRCTAWLAVGTIVQACCPSLPGLCVRWSAREESRGEEHAQKSGDVGLSCKCSVWLRDVVPLTALGEGGSPDLRAYPEVPHVPNVPT